MQEQAKGPKTLYHLFLELELRKARSNREAQGQIILSYYEALLVCLVRGSWCETCKQTIPGETINQQAQILLDQLLNYKERISMTSREQWKALFRSCDTSFPDLNLLCITCQEKGQQDLLQTFHTIQRGAKKRER